MANTVTHFSAALAMQPLRLFQAYGNWRLVRGIGELQVLTKASYLMLVIVPLIAAIWPNVRIVINQHNQTIFDAAQDLEKSRDDLARILSEIIRARDTRESGRDGTESEISAVANSLERRVKKSLRDFDQEVISVPGLPWIWAAAFFAALFVAIGHMLYQLFSPEAIRESDIHTFVSRRKEEYINQPTSNLLERAKSIVETDRKLRYDRLSNEWSVVDSRSEVFEMLRDSVKMTMGAEGTNDTATYNNIAAHLRRIEKVLERMPLAVRLRLSRELSNEVDDARDRGLLKDSMSNQFFSEFKKKLARLEEGVDFTKIQMRDELGTIEQAAHIEYLNTARSSPIIIAICAVIYGLAIVLIAEITYKQAYSVATSARIGSISDLF